MGMEAMSDVKRYGIFKFADDPPFEHEEPAMPDQETIRRYVVNLDTIIDGQPIGLASVVLASDYDALQQQLEQERHQASVYQEALGKECHARSVAEARVKELEAKYEQAT